MSTTKSSLKALATVLMLCVSFMKKHLLMILLFGTLTGCSLNVPPRMLINTNTPIYSKMAQDILQVTQAQVSTIYQSIGGAKYNYQLLLEKKADIVITQSNIKPQDLALDDTTNKDDHIRVVAPLADEILLIVYPDSLHPSSLSDLITGRRIGLGPKEGGLESLLYPLLYHAGIDTTTCTFVHTPTFEQNKVSDDIQVACFLADYRDSIINRLLADPSLKIFSFGDPSQLGKGTFIEGFCSRYPYIHPEIVPQQVFRESPKKPVLTISLSTVLLANKDVPKHLIYNFLEELYNFENKTGTIFTMREDFDPNILYYPLHAGTKAYRSRNKPSWLVHYAKPIGTVVSVLGMLVTVFLRWRTQKREKLLNQFYERALTIEANLRANKNKGNSVYLIEAKEELWQLKKEAFDLLIHDTFKANSKFMVFQHLVEDLLMRWAEDNE